MLQIRWENIPEKAQALGFPKLIELLSPDNYFLQKIENCPLGGLIRTHHGIFCFLVIYYQSRIRNTAYDENVIFDKEFWQLKFEMVW